MRVAHVSCYLDPARRAPASLLEAWPTLGDVAAAAAAHARITVVQAAHADADLERRNVRFVFVSEREPTWLRRRCGTWAWPMPERLAERVKAIEPDIIHLHGLSFARHARYLRRAVPAARILVQDHADHPPPRWRRGIQRRGLAVVDGVAFTAAEQAEPFFQSGVLPAVTRVFEVPESSTHFRPGDCQAAREATGVYGDPCLLWLGHLNSNKDPLSILDALRLAAPELPDVHLWMCYRNAALLEVLRARMEADPVLGCRVHLLGEQPHEGVELLLRAADFLVQGSHVEGSGYAVIEALACGTTPLVTDIPSFRALTQHGRYGGLSRPGDARGMARTIVDWSCGDRPAQRLAARAHFERNLSFKAVGERLRDAYLALLA